ncbi:TOBE domain-containing protein, partial [Streptomyces sp. TRM76130]|nr:TOBE domain-containing protein [Streptomyces sp. TRM76130]
AVGEGLPCTVAARTFKGTHVAVRLQPEEPAEPVGPEGAPRLEAACALRAAPEIGERVGVRFDAAEVVVLG